MRGGAGSSQKKKNTPCINAQEDTPRSKEDNTQTKEKNTTHKPNYTSNPIPNIQHARKHTHNREERESCGEARVGTVRKQLRQEDNKK